MAAARGYRVVLFEASDVLGGQLKLAKLVPWREALSGIVRWLERELREARGGASAQDPGDGDEEEERTVDQVVCEVGTLPNDELYFGLKPHSRNLGEIDLDALAEDKLRLIESNPEGRFQLFRVGDAVLGRNVHAAIYESARILKNV
jgi:N-methyl-L-proline demethylase